MMKKIFFAIAFIITSALISIPLYAQEDFFKGEFKLFEGGIGKEGPLSNSITGQRGLLRVESGENYPVKGGGAGIFISYFSEDNFMNKNISHTRVESSIFFLSSPISPIEISIVAKGFSHMIEDKGPGGDSYLVQGLGDVVFLAKVYYPNREGIFKILRPAADVGVYTYSLIDKIGWDLDCTSISPKGMLTLNFSEYIPLLVHLNAGYLFDNSEKLLKDRYFEIYSRDKFEMGIDGEDRILLGAGLETYMMKYSFASLFVEYTSMMGDNTNVTRITPGLNFFFFGNSVIHFAADISLTPKHENKEVIPFLTFIGGFSYNLFPKK